MVLSFKYQRICLIKSKYYFWWLLFFIYFALGCLYILLLRKILIWFSWKIYLLEVIESVDFIIRKTKQLYFKINLFRKFCSLTFKIIVLWEFIFLLFYYIILLLFYYCLIWVPSYCNLWNNLTSTLRNKISFKNALKMFFWGVLTRRSGANIFVVV